jgi:NAD(P)-dependent dehydrogenase (short-subunit alcohol dehydrogenase family)
MLITGGSRGIGAATALMAARRGYDVAIGYVSNRLAGNIPMQRGGHADEVAETILWLASDAAGYVTGTLVNCSGGR